MREPREKRDERNDEKRHATKNGTRRGATNETRRDATNETRREANWEERGEFRRLPEKPSKGWGELGRTGNWSFWQFQKGRRDSELDVIVPRMAGALSF